MEIHSANHLAATKQTWRNKVITVRELFAQIVEANPRGSETTWRKAFLETVKDDTDALEAISDYTFDACFRAYVSIKTHERTKKTVVQQKKQKAAESAVAEEAASFIKEKIILLNQEMPNGKRARNCTLDYFYRLGGAYRKLGKQGDRTLIGAKYNETEYRAKLEESILV